MDLEKGHAGALPEAEAKREVFDVLLLLDVFVFAFVVLLMEVDLDVDLDADPPGGTLPTRCKEVRCCCCCLVVVLNWRLLFLFRGERKVVAVVAAEDEAAVVEVVWDNISIRVLELDADVVDVNVNVVDNNGEAMNPAEISANAPNQQKIVRLVERRRWTCISQQSILLFYVEN